VQQHAVGIDLDRIADVGVAGDPDEVEQLRVKQRLAADQSEFLDMHGLGDRPDVALVILQRGKFPGHQRRRVIAMVAAEVAMLGQVVFDAEQPDFLPRADERIHLRS